MNWRQDTARTVVSDPPGFGIVKSLTNGRVFYTVISYASGKPVIIHSERDIAPDDPELRTPEDDAALAAAWKRCKEICK